MLRAINRYIASLNNCQINQISIQNIKWQIRSLIQLNRLLLLNYSVIYRNYTGLYILIIEIIQGG